MDIEQIKKFLTAYKDTIDNLILPLKPRGITYLTFARNYPGKKIWRISNRPDFINSIYDNNLDREGPFSLNPQAYQFGYVFWKDLKFNPIFNLAKSFGIINGITLIKPNKHCCDFFHFAFDENSEDDHSFLIKDELFSFIPYLQEKLYTITRNIDAQLIGDQYFESAENNKYDYFRELRKNKELASRLQMDIDAKKYNISLKNYHVAKLLCTGLNAKEIAEHLFISPRTAEEQIQSLKNIFDCKSLFQLGVKLSIGLKSIGA